MKGDRVRRALEALAELGPMTRAEIEVEIGIDKRFAGRLASALNHASPKFPKRIYIKTWIYEAEGARRYPRAVYAIGSRPDAPKPARDIAGAKARYWAKRRDQMRYASVFHLGLSRRQLLEIGKAA